MNPQVVDLFCELAICAYFSEIRWIPTKQKRVNTNDRTVVEQGRIASNTVLA